MPCQLGKKSCPAKSLVTAGLKVMRKLMAWSGRDRVVHTSVLNQQFQTRHMLVKAEGQGAAEKGPPNIGLAP